MGSIEFHSFLGGGFDAGGKATYAGEELRVGTRHAFGEVERDSPGGSIGLIGMTPKFFVVQGEVDE